MRLKKPLLVKRVWLMEITWVPIVDISEIGSVVDELSDNLLNKL
jgi:hypothetical protein